MEYIVYISFIFNFKYVSFVLSIFSFNIDAVMPCFLNSVIWVNIKSIFSRFLPRKLSSFWASSKSDETTMAFPDLPMFFRLPPKVSCNTLYAILSKDNTSTFVVALSSKVSKSFFSAVKENCSGVIMYVLGTVSSSLLILLYIYSLFPLPLLP